MPNLYMKEVSINVLFVIIWQLRTCIIYIHTIVFFVTMWQIRRSTFKTICCLFAKELDIILSFVIKRLLCYCAQFSTNVHIIYNFVPKEECLGIGVMIWSIFCGKFDMQPDLSNIILQVLRTKSWRDSSNALFNKSP